MTSSTVIVSRLVVVPYCRQSRFSTGVGIRHWSWQGTRCGDWWNGNMAEVTVLIISQRVVGSATGVVAILGLVAAKGKTRPIWHMAQFW
jgi:hypothetical protein